MIFSTGGLFCISSSQAAWIRSQRSFVSPSLAASAGRAGRSPDDTLITTAGSRLHESNGRSPVNTCPWGALTLNGLQAYYLVAAMCRTSMATMARA